MFDNRNQASKIVLHVLIINIEYNVEAIDSPRFPIEKCLNPYSTIQILSHASTTFLTGTIRISSNIYFSTK